MVSRTRSISKFVYIDDVEQKILEHNMSYYGIRTFSTYARKMLLYPQTKIVNIDSSQFNDMVQELKRIGTNINQLAKIANQTKQLDSEKVNELVTIHQNLIADLMKDYATRIKKLEEENCGSN